ncbi:MAG: hypothetical protein ACLUI3_06670 [Christensenellales bacterium]
MRFAVLHAWLNRSGQWDVTEWAVGLNRARDRRRVRYFGRPLILPISRILITTARIITCTSRAR